MYSVHCPEQGEEVLLGPRSILSMHNTAHGVTGYFRCACGALGIFETDRATGVTTAHHPGAVTTEREPAVAVTSAA